MPRISGTNTFEGGMVKDLNPIVVPKNVMTDCLNGTLITYNGNEFALQNDMGNYRFNNGHLGKGFVPVGMKEYGGVLYIISYNPTENQVEIGSFPSQKTIFDGHTEEEGEAELKKIKLDNLFNLYSDLIEQSKIIVLNTDDNCFINPGDEYRFTNDGDKDTENVGDLYQHLHSYILTDDKKLFDIQGYIDLETGTDFTPAK